MGDTTPSVESAFNLILPNNTIAMYNWSAGLTDEELASMKLFQVYPKELLQFAAACCIIFMLIGIPGNLITIIALARCKKVRNATAIFIINLSFSDLLHCCFDLPLATSTFITQRWPYGVILCRVYPFFRFSLAAVSLFTVFAITINRYIMISHPRLYPKLYKPRNLAIIIAVIWIVSFGSLTFTWIEVWGRFGMDPNTGICSLIPDINNKSPERTFFLCAFLIPCIAIIVCYARIYFVVRKSTDNSRPSIHRRIRDIELDDSSVGTSAVERTDDSENESTVESGQRKTIIRMPRPISSPEETFGTSRFAAAKSFRQTILRRRVRDKSLPTSKDKKLLTMITAIMVAFFVCHLPLTIIKVSSVIMMNPVLTIISYILRYTTSCVNPIIYVVMSSEYRKAYKKVMKRPTCDKECRFWR